MKKRIWIVVAAALSVALLIGGVCAARWFGWPPPKTYTAEDFNLVTVQSGSDFNRNGVDDLTDLLNGAKKDAAARPRYNGAYYQTGYPPENVGVCTDLVWRAFREAGYALRDMVDADIRLRPADYGITAPDPNIDFRRVSNLKVFFEAYATPLTTDINDIGAWQPGDIVLFGGTKHIGIVSNLRNEKGQPYILHNGGQWQREENLLPRRNPTAHYRFDPQSLPQELRIAMESEPAA